MPEYQDNYDTGAAQSSLTNRTAWTQRAVELAVEHHTIGKASLRPFPTAPVVHSYVCAGSADLHEHLIGYDTETKATLCDCTAGTFGRPCSHAGAVLLLVAGLVAPYARTGSGGKR